MTASDSSPEFSATLSLRSGDQAWGSERRMALLAAIGTEGSISAAARKIGLSYKAAWDAVDMMNNLAGDLLVERVTGGVRGGGAQLTDRARQLVAWYQAVQAEHQRFMEVLSRFGPDSQQHLDLLQSMALQTSARNRFEGVIGQIDSGPVNDRLSLVLDDTHSLTATLTHASTERLGLVPGRRALAFIKAQAVRIETMPTQTVIASSPEHTCWEGRVRHSVTGDGLQEISLSVSPQRQVTGILNASSHHPALVAGASARAWFPAADVLIGTLD
ncbi:TOBE domain-containing protein [Castellaniella sp.]|uniref:TOBE domain-containing protein n=1 Tax=Castellaniella sp. TaxID=1955812 RepID=UPI002B003739|nr:TOBE domain-containing protein [Castellaniella sp.]